MRGTRYVLVLLVAFAFGLSFALPTEDVPETAYDESESLPYESVPLSSSEVLAEHAQALHSTAIFHSQLQLGCVTKRDGIRAEQEERSMYPISDSLIILEHYLRC